MVESAKAIEFASVTVKYADKVALRDLSFSVPEQSILGVVGPANSGKTTMLKCINRTIDLAETSAVEGIVKVQGEDVASIRNVYELRRKVGMVFPLPVGLPLSIYENVAYAPRRVGMNDKTELDELIEKCLRQAMLWDEVKDRLGSLGTKLSGGQQQRLTLARALSHRPAILCLDEFSIAIDPVTTMKIEDVLQQLKEEMTIVLVTNLVQQARRLADRVMFLNSSNLVEFGDTEKLFTEPENSLTGDYLNGEFG